MACAWITTLDSTGWSGVARSLRRARRGGSDEDDPSFDVGLQLGRAVLEQPPGGNDAFARRLRVMQPHLPLAIRRNHECANLDVGQGGRGSRNLAARVGGPGDERRRPLRHPQRLEPQRRVGAARDARKKRETPDHAIGIDRHGQDPDSARRLLKRGEVADGRGMAGERRGGVAPAVGESELRGRRRRVAVGRGHESEHGGDGRERAGKDFVVVRQP